LVLITMRSRQIRVLRFFKADRAVDAEMLTIACTIIERRSGKFDPSKLRDRYQEAKVKGLPIKPEAVPSSAPVIDLMAALKRNLAQAAPTAKVARVIRGAKTPDRRQRALLLPASGDRKMREEPMTVSSEEQR
jgi:non-homologous end joining protein Ku